MKIYTCCFYLNEYNLTKKEACLLAIKSLLPHACRLYPKKRSMPFGDTLKKEACLPAIKTLLRHAYPKKTCLSAIP